MEQIETVIIDFEPKIVKKEEFLKYWTKQDIDTILEGFSLVQEARCTLRDLQNSPNSEYLRTKAKQNIMVLIGGGLKAVCGAAYDLLEDLAAILLVNIEGLNGLDFKPYIEVLNELSQGFRKIIKEKYLDL